MFTRVNEVQHNSTRHKKPANGYVSNEGKGMIPEKAERLHKQSQSDKTPERRSFD